MELEIQDVDWASSRAILSDIRKAVFIIEQGVPKEDEWDTADTAPTTVHFLARMQENAIGVARLVFLADNQIKIGRLALLPKYRNRGWGYTLMQHAVSHALSCSPKRILIHAQCDRQNFYSRLGFIPEGKVFDEAGIPHIKMIFDPSHSTCLNTFYGERVIRLESSKEFSQHLSQLAHCARLSIDIFSHQLPNDIFSESTFIAGVSALARRDRRCKVRILLKADAINTRSLPPLITLYRKLPSKIALRCISDDYDETLNEFTAFDKIGLCLFNSTIPPTGFSGYAARAECRKLMDKFDYIWDHQSDASQEFSEFII